MHSVRPGGRAAGAVALVGLGCLVVARERGLPAGPYTSPPLLVNLTSAYLAHRLSYEVEYLQWVLG